MRSLKLLVKNKKSGYTLIEIVVAIALFAIVSLCVFQIVNMVPKLFNTQSTKVSERTDIKKAFVGITKAIQDAKEIHLQESRLLCTLSDDSQISFTQVGSQVIRTLNEAAPTVYMEGVTFFQVARIEEEDLYSIYIKTENEVDGYNYKVNPRLKNDGTLHAIISTVSPAAAVFDKNPANQADVAVDVHLNGNKLNYLYHGDKLLQPGIHYTISGNTVLIKKEYLYDLTGANEKITFDVSNGIDPVLNISIINTAAIQQIQASIGNFDVVRMLGPGNTSVDPADRSWVIRLANCNLKNMIPSGGIEVLNLPAGLGFSYTAADASTLILTVQGSANPAVNLIQDIRIRINPSAVEQTGFSASDYMTAKIIPAGVPYTPDQFVVYSNDVIMGNNAVVKGVVVTGRNNALVTIDKIHFTGDLYVACSFKADNNNSVYNGNVYVSGNIDLARVSISRNLYFSGNEIRNRATFQNKYRQNVAMPPKNVPPLKSYEWYVQNGYTIVTSSSYTIPAGTTGSNLKYYFTNNCVVSAANANNIVLVGEKNITLSNGSYINNSLIFAPNAGTRVSFGNTSSFIGSIISDVTIINNVCYVEYKKYEGQLPFDFHE